MDYYIGLMSGTSLDGVDAALVGFADNQIHLIETHYQQYPTAFRKRLQTLCFKPQVDIRKIGVIDSELGTMFGECALAVLEKSKQQVQDIIAIGSHGQTLYHAPEQPHPFTIQLGNPNQIAAISGIAVVADFRRADMAAGGQGAPLVPAFHQDYFHSENENRIILNLGGIANITVLPTAPESPVIGFDTGPGNTLLDLWTQRHFNQPYDQQGRNGERGNICPTLLKTLLNDPYFAQAGPKSTGQEYFSEDWLEERLQASGQHRSANDVLTTLYALSCTSISETIKTVAPQTEKVLVCGGGVQNDYLMKLLGEHLSPIQVDTTAQLNIAPDWVEAIAFAWLAQRHITQQPSNLPSATGARQAVILGGYYPKPLQAGH